MCKKAFFVRWPTLFSCTASTLFHRLPRGKPAEGITYKSMCINRVTIRPDTRVVYRDWFWFLLLLPYSLVIFVHRQFGLLAMHMRNVLLKLLSHLH
jgi:hypothetical protein